MVERQIGSVPYLQRGMRLAMRATVSPVFPRETHDTAYPFQEGTGMERAKKLMALKYGGLFDITHFAYSDLPQALATLQFEWAMLDKQLLIGAGAHQIKPFVIPTCDSTGIKVLGIVTEDTMEKAKEEGNPKGYVLHQGLGKFSSTSMDYLASGNHVLLAGQGGRRPTLLPNENLKEKPKYDKTPTTMGTFFLNAAKHKVTKFFYMPVGLSLIGAQDYRKEIVGEYNLFKKYRVNRGLVFTYDEIMQSVGGDYRKVDEYLFRLKANLVSEAYFNIQDED